jgi:hypothetical protein
MMVKLSSTFLSTKLNTNNVTERLEMIKQARNGGSMTPKFRKILQSHEDRGRVTLHPFTTISSASWSIETHTWAMSTSSALVLPPIDHVIYATGAQPNIATLPMFQPLLKDYPIEAKGGMPCLTNDLMWDDEVPCLVTGRLAALRLGPGAGNLEGARLGAERCAWKIEELLRAGRGKGPESDAVNTGDTIDLEEERKNFCDGVGSQFSVLEGLGAE